MYIEGIDINDIEFGEPIEEREGTFFDGYRYGLYKAHNIIDNQCKEIERLNNIINELNTAYCKVITKCEEMIDSRFYMNDIAIKKYADEIKDICKYYVGEAKELKGEKE